MHRVVKDQTNTLSYFFQYQSHMHSNLTIREQASSRNTPEISGKIGSILVEFARAAGPKQAPKRDRKAWRAAVDTQTLTIEDGIFGTGHVPVTNPDTGALKNRT